MTDTVPHHESANMRIMKNPWAAAGELVDSGTGWLEWGGPHEEVPATNHASSTCSKLGTLNQHDFPSGISPAIKQVPSLGDLL